MQDPLREIFEELYEGKIGHHPMTKKERKVWARAQAVLGEKTIDQMLYAQSRSQFEAQCACFRAGFILGARLMLELR